MWILSLAEDSLETSSLIFSEKQWKNIYEWHMLSAAVVIGTLTINRVAESELAVLAVVSIDIYYQFILICLISSIESILSVLIF